MEDLYQTNEWKSLNPDIRFDLVPLIEKLRHGARIDLSTLRDTDSIKYNLEKVISDSKLIFRNFNKNYYICDDISLLEKLDSNDISIGEFLGYPACCIINFETTSMNNSRAAMNYWKNAKKSMEEGNFNLIMLYALHVPCSVQCKETVELAGKIREVLELKDPVVADYIVNQKMTTILRLNIKE